MAAGPVWLSVLVKPQRLNRFWITLLDSSG